MSLHYMNLYKDKKIQSSFPLITRIHTSMTGSIVKTWPRKEANAVLAALNKEPNQCTKIWEESFDILLLLAASMADAGDVDGFQLIDIDHFFTSAMDVRPTKTEPVYARYVLSRITHRLIH